MKKLNVSSRRRNKRALHSGMYASALAVVVLIVDQPRHRALPIQIHPVRYFPTSLFHVGEPPRTCSMS